MRAPLSWLRDYAPFPDDTSVLRAALDDLGLVVEAVERVGEGLEDVVVARVEEISAIEGADKIRRVVVDAGAGPLEIVCGADNFTVGDRVPLAPVGATLPGGFAIGRRKMKGVTSNGMLCSATELDLGEDSAGLLVLGEDVAAEPGTPITTALGIEPDVVFDITVEGNRPDAWCMVGIARDLASRLGLHFTLPTPPTPANDGRPVGDVASAAVSAPDMCPRLTVSVLSGITVGPSPDWIARRLTLAGMRPINNVVDASNYVMLELGQPTHPYDLSKLPGRGLIVRRAKPKETLETLDGLTRLLGVPGRGLGDTGEDCLICDAEDNVVGVGGIMGGASSEISDATTEVLLEAAYFTPMVIARTSKRLALRTEASARFERGCDPWGIDASIARFCQLLGESTSGLTMAEGILDVRAADVPEPFEIPLPIARVHGQIGVALDRDQIARLIEPIGFSCYQASDDVITVTVPTTRPDIRPAPFGIDDIIEEIARTFGYSNVPRRVPTWAQPGHLDLVQKDRRRLKDVLNGLGASEGWTSTFVSEQLDGRVGLAGHAVKVSNPLDAEEPFLRRSLLPGLLDALEYNTARRQPSLRLFEVGVVFSHPDDGHPRVVERAGAGGAQTSLLPGERELLGVVFALDGDDVTQAVAAWHVLADAFRLDRVRLRAPAEVTGTPAGLHPTRCAELLTPTGTVLGVVGEIDPDVATAFGLTQTVGGATRARRVGWLEVDLGLLFDHAAAPRRTATSGSVSRFPSSDIDLALVVGDQHPADAVADVLATAGGELLESVTLFDVYRGAGVPQGHRSLAYRLRFCSPERTLTDDEVGILRQRCIDAVVDAVGAALR